VVDSRKITEKVSKEQVKVNKVVDNVMSYAGAAQGGSQVKKVGNPPPVRMTGTRRGLGRLSTKLRSPASSLVSTWVTYPPSTRRPCLGN
jgi:hypothetical protein